MASPIARQPNPQTSVPTSIDGSELMTGEAVSLDLRPTAFVLRAAGAIIDFVLSIGIYLLAVLALGAPLISGALDDATKAALNIGALVFCVVVIPTAVETISQGKSLGRLAIGARIVRDDGGSIGLRHAFIRALTGVLEIYMSLGGIAVFAALLNGRSKRVGDLLAGTYSQNERVPRLVDTPLVIAPQLAAWATTADVAKMPDALARRIAQYLRQAARLTGESRDRLGHDLANEAARYVSPVPAAPTIDFLTAVSVVRRDREYRALQLESDRLKRLEPALEGLPHGFPDRG
jgi:uncharacterized RDD family membrane protein YckC